LERPRRDSSPVARQYDAVAFAVFLTILIVFDAFLLDFFVSQSYAYLLPYQIYYQGLSPPQLIPFQFWVPVLAVAIIIFFLTIAPQFVISRLMGRTIPAILPQIAGLGYTILFWGRQQSGTYLVTAFFAAGYFVFGMAIAQDELVLALLGKKVERRDMELRSVKVFAEPEDIKRVLLTPRIRKSLNLRKEPEETEPSVMLIERKPTKFAVAIELSKPPQSGTTFLNMAAYDERRYSLRWSEDLQDFAESRFDYIKGILSRFDFRYEQGSEDDAVSVAEFVEDRLQSSITKAVERLGPAIFTVYAGAVLIPILGGLVGVFPFELGLGLGIGDFVIIVGDARRRRGARERMG
jgi:hypothetical protein